MRTWHRNGFYHRLLLRQIPPGARRSLDVGCGAGEFAARVAACGVNTVGIDLSTTMVDHARERFAGVTGLSFRVVDVTRTDLPRGHYDYISCLACIHHVPFEPVLARLREALSPAGVLVVLGLYRAHTPAERLLLLVAVPANLVVSAVASLRPRPDTPRHPVRPASMTLAEVREAAARQLPGAVIRRHLFWRYSLVYQNST
ncbi:class I SAM-dependent methyltransferase [Nocardia sp. NPDC050378]|uniref:class I SAM-dependent methyltransferase n=1 Tax=Nocardia sp. NPDC050378 TaxID=3155400 RepID=UPI0033D5008B